MRTQTCDTMVTLKDPLRCVFLSWIYRELTHYHEHQANNRILRGFEYSFGDVGSSKWLRQNDILIWSACSWWIVWFKEKKTQHLALLPTLNGVSLPSACCLKLIYVQFEKDIRPFHSGAFFYSNLIKWNWKLCKCTWRVRTAGRARTSETHASIIGNIVLFRDIGFIVIVPSPRFEILDHFTWAVWGFCLVW